VCAKTYAAHGFPFFKIYKEESTIKGDFEGIKSVKELDKAKFQGSKGNAAGKDSLMTDDDENTSSSDSETDAEDEGEEMSAYPEPPLKNPTILLNPDGAAMEFRPVSELEEELLSMNAVQF